jgi:hypothetical protein
VFAKKPANLNPLEFYSKDHRSSDIEALTPSAYLLSDQRCPIVSLYSEADTSGLPTQAQIRKNSTALRKKFKNVRDITFPRGCFTRHTEDEITRHIEFARKISRGELFGLNDFPLSPSWLEPERHRIYDWLVEHHPELLDCDPLDKHSRRVNRPINVLDHRSEPALIETLLKTVQNAAGDEDEMILAFFALQLPELQQHMQDKVLGSTKLTRHDIMRFLSEIKG